MKGKLTGLSSLVVGWGMNLGSVKGVGQSKDGCESVVASNVSSEVTVVTVYACGDVIFSCVKSFE